SSKARRRAASRFTTCRCRCSRDRSATVRRSASSKCRWPIAPATRRPRTRFRRLRVRRSPRPRRPDAPPTEHPKLPNWPRRAAPPPAAGRRSRRRMETCTPHVADGSASAFYADVAARLDAARIPFLIGGAFAFARYSGIARDTKDLDVFVTRADCRRALAVCREAGYRTELRFPHWLGQNKNEDHFIH